MNSTRQYWKEKALSFEQQLKDAGLIKTEKRIIASPIVKIENNDKTETEIKVVEVKEEFTAPKFHLSDLKEKMKLKLKEILKELLTVLIRLKTSY